MISSRCYRIIFIFPGLSTLCVFFRCMLILLHLAKGNTYNWCICKLVGTECMCCKLDETISCLIYEKEKNPTVNWAILPWYIGFVWKLGRKDDNLFLCSLMIDKSKTWSFGSATTCTEGKSGSFAYCVIDHLMELYFRSFLMLNDYYKKEKKGKKTPGLGTKHWAPFT